MAGWSLHTGMACALATENIDTDQLIPARFMSTPRVQGYGGFLLHDQRFDEDHNPVPEMALNRHPGTSVLIARRNFGSGSSREAAVYALVDFGIKAVIAPSFGDIFAGNAVNNGLLPAQVGAETVEQLIAALGADAVAAQIDLETGQATIGAQTIDFQLDPVFRLKLMNGWDDIDLTRQDAPAIAAFQKRRRAQVPWAWPAGDLAATSDG
jgi:3-isopropylmalate/(R)-2-methylmalate dehydratase small subunit